jgi:hypothetical protein
MMMSSDAAKLLFGKLLRDPIGIGLALTVHPTHREIGLVDGSAGIVIPGARKRNPRPLETSPDTQIGPQQDGMISPLDYVPIEKEAWDFELPQIRPQTLLGAPRVLAQAFRVSIESQAKDHLGPRPLISDTSSAKYAALT